MFQPRHVSGLFWGILGICLVALICLFVIYVANDREWILLDEKNRSDFGGSYIKLSDGFTHFEISGPENGPTVVLVHGGTVPMFLWDKQVAALTGAGFRVLRYDQYGRGYSDRPNVEYDRELHQRQLKELLEALSIDKPVTLVGQSSGGPVVAIFTVNNPDRVEKLVLIAPVLDYAKDGSALRKYHVPFYGEWRLRVFQVPDAVKKIRRFFSDSGADDSYGDRYEQQTQIIGFERFYLSLIRSDYLLGYQDIYPQLNNIPVLVLWGSRDEDVSSEDIKRILLLVKQANSVEFNAGHGVNIEKAEAVNRSILEFLGKE